MALFLLKFDEISKRVRIGVFFSFIKHGYKALGDNLGFFWEKINEEKQGRD